MFVSIHDYIGRISNTLENVIAPDLQTDFARSQVYAVMALLGSLSKKVEYKRELIQDEVNAGTDIIKAICSILKDAEISVPTEVQVFMNELEKKGPVSDIAYIEKVNEQFRCTLDTLYQNKEKIDLETFDAMDKKIRGYIHDISLRDVGFMPTMSFDKILRAGKE